jgi:hypothetical protein
MPEKKDYEHEGFTETQLEFMRQDLESDMSLTKIINMARESMESRGLDFDAEFEKWKEDKDV